MSSPAWQPPARAHFVGPHASTKAMSVTVVFRRPDGDPPTAAIGFCKPMARQAFVQQQSAHPDDIAKVRSFVADNGLTEKTLEAHRRIMHIEGTPEALAKAFDVELQTYQPIDGQGDFVTTSRAPKLPEGVIAVLGLDRRPVAQSYLKRFHKHAPDPFNPGSYGLTANYSPVKLAKVYNFPPEYDGTGQCIAIIELGGGFVQNNLDEYFSEIAVKGPKVTSVSVLGAQNRVGSDADGEVQLDIEVAGAMANGASYAVYFAPNTDQGFYEAVSQATHDTVHNPSVISISWGSPENQWTEAARNALAEAIKDATALGITVTVASGDNGASDGLYDGQLHCDFPASSPFCLACGGTKLIISGEHIAQETVWNESFGGGATGGGVSEYFTRPGWQGNSNVPMAPNGFCGRGVPDVSAVADPTTGYDVRVDGQDQVVGGTSAVAPLWAALIARLNQAMGKRIGHLNEVVYQLPASVFNDVRQGNNDGYTAGEGWDPATGLGSPNGKAILEALRKLDGEGNGRLK